MGRDSFSAMTVGDFTEVTIPVTAEHLDAPAKFFEDHHPIHNDADFARERGHHAPTLAGSMIAGIMSSGLAEMLKICGLAMLEYTVRYKAPVYEGDVLTARCEITGKEAKPHRGGGLIFLKTTLHNQDGTLVAEGKAVDLVSD